MWAALGRSYEGVAREAFAKLQTLDADSPYIWLLAADVMTVEEKYPQAFSLIRKAQTALPTLPGVHHTLARVYLASGHADWAAVAQKRAEEEQPACGTVPVACAYLSGKLEDVIARTAAASQPTALYWRARAANDLAARSFDTLEKLPPSVERYVVRAGIARDQNQPLEAATQLREALKLAPGDPSLERELAGALYAARDFEGALPLLEKLYSMAPDAPDLQVALGEALLQAQQVDRAVGLLTKAVAAVPSMLPAHASLGRALVQSGEFEKAIPHLEKALAEDAGRQRALPAGAGDAAHRQAGTGEDPARRIPETIASCRPGRSDDTPGRTCDHASGSVTSRSCPRQARRRPACARTASAPRRVAQSWPTRVRRARPASMDDA